MNKWKWYGIIATVMMTGIAATPSADHADTATGTLINYAGDLSRLGVGGILGLVALVSLRMTAKLYADKEIANKELLGTLNSTIKENTQAQQSVRDVISRCQKG